MPGFHDKEISAYPVIGNERRVVLIVSGQFHAFLFSVQHDCEHVLSTLTKTMDVTKALLWIN